MKRSGKKEAMRTLWNVTFRDTWYLLYMPRLITHITGYCVNL